MSEQSPISDVSRIHTRDVYDVSAPQPEGHGGPSFAHNLPSLLFPLVDRWDQLFRRTYRHSDKGRAVPYIVHGVRAIDYSDRQRKDMEIGPFCTVDLQKVGGPLHASCDVEAHDEVCRAMIQQTVCLRGETMHWKVIAWSEEKTIVVCEHGLILGGQWTAIIRTDTIPWLAVEPHHPNKSWTPAPEMREAARAQH